MTGHSPFGSLSWPARVTGVLVFTAGMVLMAVAWFQTTGRVQVDRQTDWAGVGLAGATLVCLVAAGWLLGGRSAIRVRLAAVDLPRSALMFPAATTARGGTAADADDSRLVATANMGLYHRPFCPLARGKAVEVRSLAEHRAADRDACGVCGA